MVSEWHRQGERVALVPTMGALHDGHLSLIRQAKEHAAHVVVSVFVNPTQFAPGEDYERYPRTLETDMEKCRSEGVSLVFAPDRNEMYGSDDEERPHYLSVRISGMNRHLCGASRPGHFEGVLQVVNKLFNIVRPDVAVFGQKDIQQWFIIRQMAEEFEHPVEILMGPTRRESDGLAKSSRNVYLSPDQRRKAPMLFASLKRFSDTLREQILKQDADSGEIPVPGTLLSGEKQRFAENGFKLDYFSIVGTPDLQPVDVIVPGRLYVIAAAAWLGNTRLIDNVLLNTRKE